MQVLTSCTCKNTKAHKMAFFLKKCDLDILPDTDR